MLIEGHIHSAMGMAMGIAIGIGSGSRSGNGTRRAKKRHINICTLWQCICSAAVVAVAPASNHSNSIISSSNSISSAT